MKRVAARVASGGHHIPEDVIRRRYDRGLENFFNHYSSVANSWILYNNTMAPARPIAWRDVGDAMDVGDNRLWTQLVARYMKPRTEQPEIAAAAEKLWTAEEVTHALAGIPLDALQFHGAETADFCRRFGRPYLKAIAVKPIYRNEIPVFSLKSEQWEHNWPTGECAGDID